MQPYYEQDGITIYHGDCRDVLPHLAVDLVVTDPPYGVTSLEWDQVVDGWECLLRTQQAWVFGSIRYLVGMARSFDLAGWKLAQDIVWEKHNGSGFAADRFRRVHEHALHFYRGKWSELYVDVPVTMGAKKRSVNRRAKPTHTGNIGDPEYRSEDGGPLLVRSVMRVRSCHGRAEHPTQKPTGILAPLIQCSCPPGGLVLDPFSGSGSTLIAAREQGRCAVGIENEERYCEIAAKRLAQGVFQF